MEITLADSIAQTYWGGPLLAALSQGVGARTLTPFAGPSRLHWLIRGDAFLRFQCEDRAQAVEKLGYTHRHPNPVTLELASEPGQWASTSFRDYLLAQTGIVRVNDADVAGTVTSSSDAFGTHPLR